MDDSSDSNGELVFVEPADSGPDQLSTFVYAENCASLIRSIAALPATLRTAADLVILNELTLQEAGQILEISYACVKSRLARARRRLSLFHERGSKTSIAHRTSFRGPVTPQADPDSTRSKQNTKRFRMVKFSFESQVASAASVATSNDNPLGSFSPNGKSRKPETLIRSNSLVFALFAGALALGSGILSGCGNHASATSAKPRPPMKVTVVRAAQSDVPIASEWVGTLDGYVNAQIQPQANGYLVRQDYREGSQVQEGQVLFEIDPRPFEAALQQAQGQLGQAQAQFALAQINVNRDTPLAEAHAIAKSQLDNEIQQKAQAEAAVKTAEAAVATASLNLGFTKVRSLITGVAGQATTQVGNLVNTQSVLTSVSRLNPIKVYFSISDNEYLALSKQASRADGKLLQGTSRIPLTLVLSNGDVYPHEGHVVFVDRQLNSQTGAIRIAAAFPNSGNLLRPGQFGRVKAATEMRHNAILVPQAALYEFQGQEQVYTVGPNNTAHANNVTVGPQYGNYWIVESGLRPGSLIITDNVQKLREGESITPEIVGAQVVPTPQPAQSGRR